MKIAFIYQFVQHPSCCILQWRSSVIQTCTELLSSAVRCASQALALHFVFHSFSVTLRIEMFHSYLLYVSAKGKKKKSSYITEKVTARTKNGQSQMGVFVPLPFKILSRINLFFIKIQFMFCRCMDSQCYFAHPHAVLIK